MAESLVDMLTDLVNVATENTLHGACRVTKIQIAFSNSRFQPPSIDSRRKGTLPAVCRRKCAIRYADGRAQKNRPPDPYVGRSAAEALPKSAILDRTYGAAYHLYLESCPLLPRTAKWSTQNMQQQHRWEFVEGKFQVILAPPKIGEPKRSVHICLPKHTRECPIRKLQEFIQQSSE
ncbi:hypothetical protein B0H16DRAFT_1447462 [Mycena metata]|uniref:Uncharacterized protein n=1 Tax=Mycena metata TaxID=1033252 RepID=A0AAD7KF61_9AGAR|nr:hypothetical protein B0H16DRAFT_1447462 [Mycena metata]